MSNRTRRTRAFGIVLFWMLVAPGRLFAAEVVTLEQAIEIALKQSPALAAARFDMEAARARRTQSTAPYYPQVSASAGYDHTWYDAPSRSLADREQVESYVGGISVRQLIYDFGKTPAEAESSAQSLQATRMDLETFQRTLVRDVKQNYFEVLKGQQLVRVREEALAARKKHLEQARALYHQGLRPRIDITRSEVEVSQGELDLVAERFGLRRSRVALETLMGGAPVSGTYVLADETVLYRSPPELPTLIVRASAQRSELAAIQALIQAADAARLSAKRTGFPSLNATGGYTYFGDDSPFERELDHQWQVGLHLSLPLFTGFRQAGQVAEAEAASERLAALLRSRLLAVTEEVARAYLTVQETAETIKTAEIVLKQAQENLSLAEGRYQNGVSDGIEPIDAQVLYTAARSAWLQAVYEHQKAAAALEFAVGGQLGL